MQREDFAGLGNGHILATWDLLAKRWRFLPVTGCTELSPLEASRLGLLRATTVPGVPVITEVNLPLSDLSKPWYEATRVFGPYNGHPEFCEDWNLESGGDSDLGELLIAPFSGIVINAYDAGGGWGRILRILGVTLQGETVTWMGAHLNTITVVVGDVVTAGEIVGASGNANGRYAAHLHEQICVGAVPGPEVFGTDRRYDFRQPSVWYVEHGVPKDLIQRVTEMDRR